MPGSGLEGLKEKKMPMPNVDKNIFEMTAAEKAAESIEELPLNLFDAVKELEADQYICDTLANMPAANTSRQNTRNGMNTADRSQTGRLTSICTKFNFPFLMNH